MEIERISAPDAYDIATGYAQAVRVTGAQRVLHVSGQVPLHPDGGLPEGFTAQAEQAWANVLAQVTAAGMDKEHIVKVTIFLSDRCFTDENRAVRQRALGALEPALTVIITGIFDPAWLLEIEAVAMA